MNLDQIEDIKELKALKSKIEKKIKSHTSKPAKVKLSTLYPSIKDDHKRLCQTRWSQSLSFSG